MNKEEFIEEVTSQFRDAVKTDDVQEFINDNMDTLDYIYKHRGDNTKVEDAVFALSMLW